MKKQYGGVAGLTTDCTARNGSLNSLNKDLVSLLVPSRQEFPLVLCRSHNGRAHMAWGRVAALRSNAQYLTLRIVPCKGFPIEVG